MGFRQPARLAARLRPHTAVLILIAVILLIAAGTLTYPLGRDQGEFATLGRGLLDGKIPYVDLWNPKPPAVFYVYAAAMTLFGQTAPALRAIDLIIFPVIALALYALGSRLGDRRVGLWTVALFGVFYFTETFWTLTQNDGIALLPMTLALWCALRAASSGGNRRGWLWALSAGLLVGWAFWFKYHFALIALPAAALYLSFRETGDKPGLFWDIGGFIAGGLLSLVGGIVMLMQIGAWDALIESARLTASYTALTANFADLFAALQVALGYRWSHWGLLALLALIGLAVIARDPRRQPRRRWWVIAGWLFTGLVIMLMQAKGYDYHWLPMLPPLALLGALGVTTGLRTEGKGLSFFSVFSPRTSVLLSRLLLAALLFIMAFVINARAISYVFGNEGQIGYYTNFIAGEFNAAESQRVADLLRERVVPGDSLFIWGFRPEIYYLSQLKPATRFIFQFPLVADWYPPEWREQTADLLWAAVPPYVLVAQVDYMPWVTGSEDDSNTLLQQYPELNDWLMYNYVLDSRIGNIFVWRRKNL